jgi:hypothetical protein
MRMLAYGAHEDSKDEYVPYAPLPSCMYRFFRTVEGMFGADYLRGPNETETARIMVHNATRGFPRMIEIIDACVGHRRTVRLFETARIMVHNATRGFPRMIEIIDACVGHRRTVRLFGKVSTENITDTAVWYLKLWRIKTCGFWHYLFSAARSYDDIIVLGQQIVAKLSPV